MHKWLQGGLAVARRVPRWVVPVGLLFAVIFTAFYLELDPDYGWHLQSGIYILRHGVPSHDIFTYSAAAFPWINHEWLSDVIIAVVNSLGGYAAIAALFAAIWTAALVIASRHVRWPVLAVGAAGVLQIATARPNAWTALFFAVVLLAIERKVYWPLVPLFALWANLHGGFVLGLAMLVVAGYYDRKYLWVFAACVLATFINPYGPRLYVEIARTLLDPKLSGNIVEWKPLALSALSGFYFVLFLVIGIAMGWRRRIFVVPLILMVMAVTTLRHFPLFVVASLGVVDLGYDKLVRFLNVKPGWKQYLLPAMAVFMILVPVYQIIRNPLDFTPAAQVAQLTTTPCEGNLFNDYDFGGYLIWKLPQEKVFIDGRMPSWRMNGQFYMSEWEEDMLHAAPRQRDFAKYNVGCVLVRPANNVLLRDLKAAGWKVSLADSKAVLLRRPN